MDVQLDKFEQLAWDAELAVAIFRNRETSDFELIDLAPLSNPHNLHARGMVFIGVVAILNCVPRVALDTPLDDATLAVLSQAFVRHIEVRANAELETQCLGRLFALEDRRTDA
jgi:hypothetical protein